MENFKHMKAEMIVLSNLLYPLLQIQQLSGYKGHWDLFATTTVVVLVAKLCPTLLRPHGLQPSRLLCSQGFSRQEYWSGSPCPPQGDVPDTGIKPRSLALQEDSLPSEPPGKSLVFHNYFPNEQAEYFRTQMLRTQTEAEITRTQNPVFPVLSSPHIDCQYLVLYNLENNPIQDIVVQEFCSKLSWMGLVGEGNSISERVNHSVYS